MQEDRQLFNGRIAEAKIPEIRRTIVWLDRSDAECFGRTFISAEENLLEPVLVNEHGKASLEKRLFVGAVDAVSAGARSSPGVSKKGCGKIAIYTSVNELAREDTSGSPPQATKGL
jgi:hypothetical protein